jgi:hypothetical protein
MAVKKTPPEAHFYAWKKINFFVNLLQTLKRVINFGEWRSNGDTA